MGDLHSIAYFTDQPHSYHSPLSWEIQNFQVLNDEISHCVHGDKRVVDYGAVMEMENSPPFYDQSLVDSDLSSGYLEDALFEFRSKRRRLMMSPDDRHQPMNQNSSPPSFPSYWDFNSTYEFDNYDEFNVSGNNSSSSSQTKTSINTQFFSEKETLSSTDHVTGGIDDKKKKVHTRVVYPFALVKPGGLKGDMTLNDINERILMPPTRPVRHPVGDFAYRPLYSVDGPGLSGKAVVGLTRIQTHGRGTITIIRTKN